MRNPSDEQKKTQGQLCNTVQSNLVKAERKNALKQTLIVNTKEIFCQINDCDWYRILCNLSL